MLSLVLIAATIGGSGCARLAKFRRGLFRRDPAVPSLGSPDAPQDPVVIEDAEARGNLNNGRSAFDAESRRPVPWRALGQSVEGRPIEAAQFGSGPARVLVIGGIHGDEPEGRPLAERLAEQLAATSAPPRAPTILIIRDLNPDGTASGTRTNARGVDLNRNFPASNWDAKARQPQYDPGPRPASEPETRLLVDLLLDFRPDRILVMHSTRGQPMVNYDGPARDLADAMSRLNRYATSDTIGYPTPGSLGSYAGNDLQVPIITLELPRGLDPSTGWQANAGAIYQVVR